MYEFEFVEDVKMLILDVPYKEKDDAKNLGAKWDSSLKKWYVENKEQYYKFARWIDPYANMVIIDELYLVEGTQECFKCKKITKVIAFGVDKHLSLNRLFDYLNEADIEDILFEINQTNIQIFGKIYTIPGSLLFYLQNNYNYKEKYSKTAGVTDINNCCDNCDVLQGDYYLFNEVDSPFFIHSEEDVKKLKIYKIKLKYDLIVNACNGWASSDEMLKEYGNIIPLDIDIIPYIDGKEVKFW